MQQNEFSEMGREIAKGIAAGLMSAVAAGTAEFAREMTATRRTITNEIREAEADILVAEAERIERQKGELQTAIGGATGLKRLTLQRKLKEIEDVERSMCETVSETLAIKNAPPPATHRRTGKRFERVAHVNGTAN